MKLLKKQYLALLKVHGRTFNPDELKDAERYVSDGWVERVQGALQTTPEFLIYSMYQKAVDNGGVIAKTVKELHKYASGSPSGFISSIRSSGHVDYSFHQLCIYQGFWKAMKIAHSYSISVPDKYKYSKLVKDWMKLFGDGYMMVVEDDSKRYTFFVDMKGRMMFDPDIDFRSWQAGVQSDSVNNLKIKNKAVFFHNHKDVDKCLSSEIINPMVLEQFMNRGEKESEE